MPQFQILEQNPSFANQLAQNLGAGVGSGLQQSLQQFHKNREVSSLTSKFEKQGYPKDLAQLAAVASTGGQTELLKFLLEQRQRGPKISATEKIQESPLGTEAELEEKYSPDIGLTEKERIKREEGRFSKQSEKYGDIAEKSEKFHQEQMRIHRLQELNEAGNLPKNLGRLNVNLKSGELILPFAASGDAQEFVKIVNDFLAGAKDTFGARVTNFEVNRFLRRLPSLLNTEEGRKRVLNQMQILSEINSKYNQSILDQFDEAGGVRKIDFDTAVRNARKKISPDLKRLQNEYVSGSREEKKEAKLTPEVATEILRQAKGDKELARKIARQKGYQF